MPHGLTRKKAGIILKEGMIGGKSLTAKQEGLFGAVKGGTSRLIKGLKKKRKK